MRKYYAVRRGKTVGIFDNWTDCLASVNEYPKAEYKSFRKKSDAQAYLDGEDMPETMSEKAKITPPPGTVIAYIDGSYNATDGVYGYGAVVFHGDEMRELRGRGTDEELAEMRNISGELIGAGKVIEFALALGASRIEIYYDYEGIEKWPLKIWKAKKTFTQKYAAFVQAKMKEMDIVFHKVAAHTGDTWNDRADRLAKEAAGVVQ
ncbi:MAG: ribonuclease H family protein [Eubacteriales bacterium]|nr:ribonuclease H family protein [Eubacteriales bacterium]